MQESSGLYLVLFLAVLLGIRLVPMLIGRFTAKKDGEVLQQVHQALERNTEALHEVTQLLQEFAVLRNGRGPGGSTTETQPTVSSRSPSQAGGDSRQD